VLTRNASREKNFQIAVLGIKRSRFNPFRYLHLGSQRDLDFYPAGKLNQAREAKLESREKIRHSTRFLPCGCKVGKSRRGFGFTEGPVWIDAGHPAIAPDRAGVSCFSAHRNNNLIYRCTSEGETQVYKTKSGYTGENLGEYGQPGFERLDR